MATSIVPVHVYRVYRLRSQADPETSDSLTLEGLAEHLTELSHQGKLGAIVGPLDNNGTPAVIVGELAGMMGLAIDAAIESAAGVRLPPPPGAKAGSNRR